MSAIEETMTRDRLEECLAVLTGVRRRVPGDGPSDRAVARLTGRSEKVVADWRRADPAVPVPAEMAEWLERRAAKRLATPAPHLPRRPEDAGQRKALISSQEAESRSARVLAAMEKLGWSPAMLASFVDKAPETIRRWLKGRPEQATPVPLVEWVEAAAALGVEQAGQVPMLGAATADTKREAAERGARLQRAMDQLDWGITEVARQVDRTFEGVRQWILGNVPAPMALIDWMEGLARDAASDPPPVWVLPGGVRPADLARGVELLREAGLGRVAKMLEQMPDRMAPAPKYSVKAEPTRGTKATKGRAA